MSAWRLQALTLFLCVYCVISLRIHNIIERKFTKTNGVLSSRHTQQTELKTGHSLCFHCSFLGLLRALAVPDAVLFVLPFGLRPGATTFTYFHQREMLSFRKLKACDLPWIPNQKIFVSSFSFHLVSRSTTAASTAPFPETNMQCIYWLSALDLASKCLRLTGK